MCVRFYYDDVYDSFCNWSLAFSVEGDDCSLCLPFCVSRSSSSSNSRFGVVYKVMCETSFVDSSVLATNAIMVLFSLIVYVLIVWDANVREVISWWRFDM